MYVRLHVCAYVCAYAGARACEGCRAQKVPQARPCGVGQELHDVGGPFLRRTPRPRMLAPQKKNQKRPFSHMKDCVDDADADDHDHTSGLLLEMRNLTYDTRNARLGGAMGRGGAETS
jgi:hypothetical protein